MLRCNQGQLSLREGSAFTIGEFLSNRTFVSLRSEDLLWMVAQGDAWLQTGMFVFKRYLASPDTERDSVFRVTLDFLLGVAHFDTQVGAFAELLSHVAEAMFRRTDCPQDWEKRLANFVWNLILDAAPKEHILAMVNEVRNREVAIRMELLSRSINDALAHSKKASSNRPLRIRVLHLSSDIRN